MSIVDAWNKTASQRVALGMLRSLVILLLLGSLSVQLPPKQDLAVTVNALDQELFGAFNPCDLVKFESLLDPNVEFFHDKNGLSTGADAVTAQVKSNVCGKVRRGVVPGQSRGISHGRHRRPEHWLAPLL